MTRRYDPCALYRGSDPVVRGGRLSGASGSTVMEWPDEIVTRHLALAFSLTRSGGSSGYGLVMLSRGEDSVWGQTNISSPEPVLPNTLPDGIVAGAQPP